jgi:Ca2+-binding RTX toxin-like protein
MNSGLNDIDLWMGGLAEKPAKQPILAPMLGTTFQYVFTEQMLRLQDNDRFYYLSRLVGMNLFGEIPAQKFTDIVRRNTPSKNSAGNPAGIVGMSNPGFGIADCAASTTSSLVPGTQTCASTKVDPTNGALTHKGLDNVIMFAHPFNLSHTALAGGDGDDSIQGGLGDDLLIGGLGGDLIDGGAGNDIVSGGPGEDLLKGGAGNDVINSGTSQIGDIADGGSGNDFIHCGQCAGVAASFIGEAGNDFIQGGKNNDLKLDGGEGDDWIEGGAGNDIIDGDNGPLLNVLIAMPVFFGGNDVINGGPGQDAMSGDGGDDIFLLGDGIGFPDGTYGFDWGSYEYNHRFDNAQSARPNVWADLSGGLTNPNLAHNNDQLANIEGLSGSSGSDVLYGGAGLADVTIPQSRTALGTAGGITLTIPGAVNITAGSVITGAGIAPHTVILSAAPVVVGNSTRYQISAPNTSNVFGPLQVIAAPLEVPTLISGLPELIAGTPGAAKYAALSNTNTKWSGGAIILGGDGNDTIYPSSGSDVLHGSAYLHTCISVTRNPLPSQVLAATDVTCGDGRGFSNMTLLAQFMDSGILNSGELQIVREILPTSTPVTGLISDGVNTTYTARNNFFVGEEISIIGLTSTSAGNLSAYGSRNSVITAVTATTFTIASSAGAIAQLSDITAGTAVGTDTLDLSGGSTLNVGGAGNVAGGGISGPSTQFTFTPISGTLPAGASVGCTMTDSVSGAITTLYDFQRVVFSDGVVKYFVTGCGTVATPSTPAPPTAVPGPDALSATVSWVAPLSNGAPIDYYIVEPSKVVNGRGTVITGFTGTCAGQVAANLTTCTVTGLTAGDNVQFRVSAHNSAGTSPQSRASATILVAAGSAKTVPTLSGFAIPNKTVGDPIFRIVPPMVGSSIPGVFTLTSSAPTILQITNGDSATALAVGTSRVTALFTPTDLTRYDTATATVTVTVAAVSNRNNVPAPVSLSAFTIPAITVGAAAITLTPPTVTPAVPGQFTFSSSNPSVVRISSSTSATAVSAGTAIITALFTPTDLTAYDTATATFTVTVNADGGRSAGGNTPPAGGNTGPAGSNSLQIQLTPTGLSNFPSGSVVNLATTGGNNSRVIFSTSTPSCRIIGTDLTATSATTCHVVATAGTVTSTIDVPFTLATQTPLRISNKITSIKKNATVILTTIGGTSSGAVSYTLIDPATSCVLNSDELTATGPTTCQVKATKAGTSMYAVIESPIVTFTFN